jgi:putative sigma-54 modulation protein
MPAIVVTSRDDRLAARGREHAEDKIKKLERYFDGITRIEAIVGHEGHVAHVELVMSVGRGKKIVCSSQAEEFYKALDLALDKAEVQLTRHKERLKDHRAQKPLDAAE